MSIFSLNQSSSITYVKSTESEFLCGICIALYCPPVALCYHFITRFPLKKIVKADSKRHCCFLRHNKCTSVLLLKAVHSKSCGVDHTEERNMHCAALSLLPSYRPYPTLEDFQETGLRMSKNYTKASVAAMVANPFPSYAIDF